MADMFANTCRMQFTADDFSFVVRTLSRSDQDAVSLVELLSDEDTRDAVLDHDLLYRRILEECKYLQLSPALYFYVLGRRVLKEQGLHEKEVSDYIASVLVAFANTGGMQPLGRAGKTPAGHVYISDLFAALNGATSQQAFLLHAHIANYSLFLSGIFAERVRSHRDLRGGPDLSFYEQVGQRNYHLASEHRMAEKTNLQGVFKLLSTEFHRVRLALNQLAENLLHFEPTPAGLV